MSFNYNQMFKNLLILGFIVLLVQAGWYKKHVYGEETGARCLDGSPGYVLVHEGAEKEKILLYFLGGGFCEGSNLSEILTNCHKRSSTILGSSLLMPKEVDLDAFGILSTLKIVNPTFWNWTIAFLPYCDGTFHQGSRHEPVNFKNKDLYFRGYNNTLQHFNYLNQTYGLYSAEKVVITGESAGGIATYLWADHVYKNSVNKNVYSIPDSGLFLIDYLNPKTGSALFPPQLRALFDLVNSEVSLPLDDCIAATGSQYACMNFSNNVQYFKAPLFIIESAYDEYSVAHIIGEKCLTSGSNGAYSLDKCSTDDLREINLYRDASLAAINNFTTLPNFGAWVPSCVQHGFCHESGAWHGATYKVPSQSGQTLADAVQKFINSPNDKNGNIHIDSVQWPQNHGCSAHKKSLNLKKLGSHIVDYLLSL